MSVPNAFKINTLTQLFKKQQPIKQQSHVWIIYDVYDDRWRHLFVSLAKMGNLNTSFVVGGSKMKRRWWWWWWWWSTYDVVWGIYINLFIRCTCFIKTKHYHDIWNLEKEKKNKIRKYKNNNNGILEPVYSDLVHDEWIDQFTSNLGYCGDRWQP